MDELQAQKFVDALNGADGAFTLTGRLQHDVAAEALIGTGVNAELGDKLRKQIATHDFFVEGGVHGDKLGMRSTFTDDDGAAKRDVTLALMAHAEREGATETDRTLAGAVQDAIHQQVQKPE